MAIHSFPAIQPIAPTMPLRKALAFAAGLGLSTLSYPVNAAPSSDAETVQGLYEALLSTIENSRTLGQGRRFAQLEPDFPPGLS